MSHRIRVVSCYFGEWPEQIDLFLNSCRHNPSVDFLLVSDCGLLSHAPDNVTVVPMSFAAFRQRVSERLGMEVALDHAYKVNDFEPAYGVIWHDFLDDYDFWGWTDLDLVYGQIRKFVDSDMLSRYDVVAVRPWYLTGSFSLFRNNEHVNRLYHQSRDYEKVFQTSRHFSFEECNFAWQQLRSGSSIFDAQTEIESMTEVVRREERNGLRVYFGEMARENTGYFPLVWDRGTLAEGDKEWLLFHFVVHKDRWCFSMPQWDQVPDSYYISRLGLWDRDKPISGPISKINWMRLARNGMERVVGKVQRVMVGQ